MAEIGCAISLPYLIILIMIMIIPKSICDPNYITNFCSNTNTYSPNSSFPNTLNTLLLSLSSNATANSAGFHVIALETGYSTVVYGLFLCRGDQNNTGCGTCVSTAVRELPQRISCPRTQEVVVWYDHCIVRYSDQPLAGILDQTPSLLDYNTQDVSGNQSLFTQLLGSNMQDLIGEAANEDPMTGKKYATRVVRYDDIRHLYMLVQCTPDLSSSDCSQCLTAGISRYSTNQGGDSLQPSCIARYEIYPFFSGPSNSSVPPSSIPPSVPPSSSIPPSVPPSSSIPPLSNSSIPPSSSIGNTTNSALGVIPGTTPKGQNLDDPELDTFVVEDSESSLIDISGTGGASSC